jgi:SAM-dependent methyltransferase
MSLRDTGERVVPEFVSPRDTVAGGLLEQHLSRYRFAAGFVKGARVADVACGAGYGSRLLLDAGAASVVGVDLDPDAIRYAERRFAGPGLSFRVGNAGDPSCWDGGPFDVVVSLETLEHVPDVSSFLLAVRGALATRGRLILSASVVPTRDIYAYHLRDYDPASLRREILDRGFTVTEEFPLTNSFSPREMRRSLWYHPQSVSAGRIARRPLHYLRLALRTYLTDGLRYENLTLVCERG